MIDYSSCRLEKVSAHQVGNKTAGEDVKISKSPLNISDPKLQELLLKYFLSHFKSPELFSFTFSNEDHTLNPVYAFVKEIFQLKDSFHTQSINLAKQLYETSLHPNIKAGDFYVALFSSIMLDGEIADAIGIFKAETKDSFLKLNASTDQLSYDDGVSTEKLDKGCVVFNLDRDGGYKICIIDRSNRLTEAQYWKETFLNLKPYADNYHHTKNFLSLTKTFVTEKLTEDFQVEKADQIDLLNRSMDYFKHKDQFDESEFAQNVFGDTAVIDSFKKFKNEYEQDKGIEIMDDFDISAPAVKNQSRVFKSILKLDRNFHIYIHGNKELIEKGTEPDGRKYYKIYYKEEN